MKILLVYPYLPHPDVSHGSGRLLVPLLQLWRTEAEITLVCGYRPREARYLESARALVHDLVPVLTPLRVDLSAVGRVMESARTAILNVMRRDPIHSTKLDRVAFREAIRRARARTRFDAAQVELAGLARCVAELSGLPSVLFDHEAGVASGGDLTSDPRSLRYIQAIYPRFSSVGTLCREDAAELAAVLPRSQVVVRRPGVSPRPAVARATGAPAMPSTHPPGPPASAGPNSEGPGAQAGRVVLFFGSPDHLPNRDALQWLAEIWPTVAARAGRVRCVAAGGVASPRLSRLLVAAGIENKGFVPDLDVELAHASVVVAPVRLGRGVRMKNLEALAAGCPLVTTPLGARGLDLRDGEHALIAADGGGIADAVLRLLGDPALASRLGSAGQAHVTSAFSHGAAASFNLALWKQLASA